MPVQSDQLDLLVCRELLDPEVQREKLEFPEFKDHKVSLVTKDLLDFKELLVLKEPLESLELKDPPVLMDALEPLDLLDQLDSKDLLELLEQPESKDLLEHPELLV